jgi:hypothetical protein
MELVANTSGAVAVTEDLTTLIDWVNIERLSGSTIIVANAGGGSADDITDIQIDTSADGGITSSLDQHDGVPAVPVASGDSKTGTFTEDAAFVRVRAVCAAGDDTTATAWLLADSASARICTLADVKERLGLTNTGNDIAIARIISNLESVFNSYTRRTLIAPGADVTEYYTGQGNRLQLARYPVISVTSIKEALDYDFDSATALTVDSDYRLVRAGANGIIYRPYGSWPSVEDSVQAIYRGGYCPAGQAPGDGEFALPSDLREASIEQASFLFKRRDDIGLTGVSFEGGSISKFSAMDLLPMVKKILDAYRRPSL